jgi:Zn-dependent alcohol dehydrogenase
MGGGSSSSSSNSSNTQIDDRVSATDDAVVVQVRDGGTISIDDPGLTAQLPFIIEGIGDVITDALDGAQQAQTAAQDALDANNQRAFDALEIGFDAISQASKAPSERLMEKLISTAAVIAVGTAGVIAFKGRS